MVILLIIINLHHGADDYTVRSRYKRIVYKRISVASLAFQSVLATFIHIELNQLSLVTRTHCNHMGMQGDLQSGLHKEGYYGIETAGWPAN